MMITIVVGILILAGSWAHLSSDDEYAALPSAFLSVFDYAFADVPGVLDLTVAGNIGDNSRLRLEGASGIAIFESGGTTYAAVASHDDDGVQIIRLKNPNNPVAVGKISDTAALELGGAYGIVIFESGGTPHAAVAGYYDAGVQIINLANPARPTGVGSINDTDSYELFGAYDITTFKSGGTPYVAVTSYIDDGVQIINITDPANPVAAGSISDTADLELDAAFDIAIFNSGTATYAAVASYLDDGVQIINITDPANPVAAGSIDDTADLELDGAHSIVIFESGIDTYAAVASYTDDGVQIINITDPDNPVAAGSIDDTASLELNGASSIIIFESGTTTYAAVASYIDDGVQILDITDPYNLVAAGKISDTSGRELNGARMITTFESGGATYLAVTAAIDDGVQILGINHRPAVNASPDQTVDEGDTITLSGTASDSDGDTLTYSWTHDSALDIPFNATSPVITFAAPQVNANTTITFTLTAGDDTYTSSDSLILTITDVPAIDPPATAFVTTWQTTGADEEITIPVGGASGTYTVDWGDGITSVNVTGNQTHTYDDAGTYTISISGDFTRIVLSGNSTNAQKLQSIEQWGDARWDSMRSAFYGASNMVYNATDAPDLSAVTDMHEMFYRASSFDGDLSDWNTSSVTDMSHMFYRASSFDGDLSDWNTSSVTDMSHMFYRASSFDGDLSDWNTSSVTNMSHMFEDASSFNRPLSKWDVSKVTDMSHMFEDASSFNRALSKWDVSSVTNMSNMFDGASSFNRPLSNWDVSKVTDMSYMFARTSFDGDLSNWNVSKVTDMAGMFAFANSFNRDLSDWDVSSVTNMDSMFDDAGSFNGDISGWNVSKVTNMSEMFYNADSFNSDLSNWDASSVTNMYRMFLRASSFNSDISNWDVSSVNNMGSMFYQANRFKQNLGNWYIVPGSTSIGYDEAPGVVGRINAQNSYLNGQNPAYGIGSGGDSDSFEISGDKLRLKAVPTKSLYDVSVTATGDFGRSNSKTVTVAVTGIPSTLPPTVDAGTNQTVVEGQTVTLNGTATDINGDPLIYSWTHDSSLTIPLANSTSPSTTFAAPAVDADTDITFTLTVNDGTVADSLVVTVTDVPIVNSPPVADAGLDQTVQEGQTVTLNGTATDSDGDDLTYAWSHDSTMEITFNASSPATTFVAPLVSNDTAITFTLTVNDGTANSTDTVLVTVSDVPNDTDFVTTWETILPDDSITIPARGTYAIDWGDGTVNARVTGDQTHTYADAGNHTVRISDGITAIYLNDHADASKLRSIDQWGDAEWGSMYSSFRGASNVILHATDAPDLSRVTDARYMFMNAHSFDGDLSGWDVSRVADMDGMFWNATSFDSDLSDWDVSSVTDMYGMFASASSFDGDVSDWDVSSVTDMANMFNRASSFDSDLSDWDVSRVTDMYAMFALASSFDGDVSDWDVSSVTDMADMFRSTQFFNSDISGWNISDTTRITTMLYRAEAFDQNLGPWYIVLDDDAIQGSDVPGTVGSISTRNPHLDSQNPEYGIGPGGDSDYFEISGNVLSMLSVPDGDAGPYTVDITSTGDYGTDNSRTYEISVTEGANSTSSAAPSDPRDVGEITLSSTESGTIQITWDAPGETPRDYRVSWAKAGENFLPKSDRAGNAFTTSPGHTVTGLDEGEEYKVKVRARYNGGGPGDWSDIVTITVARTE